MNVLLRLLTAGLASGVLAAASLDEGLALKKEGRLAEAETVFRAVATAAPADVEAATQLATVVGWQGRHDEAIPLWESARRLRPDDADLTLGLARVLYWSKRYDRAAAELDALLAKMPKHVEVLLLRGDVAAAAGDRAMARSDGDRAMARSFYHRAQRLAPGDPEVMKRLERLDATEPPSDLSLRLDLTFGRDRFGSDRGRERSHAWSLAAGHKDYATVLVGFDSATPFGQREERWKVGLAGSPLPKVEAEAAYAWTSKLNEFNPDHEWSAGLGWQVLPWLQPVVDWRHSSYADDAIDLYRPGVRLRPVTWATIETRYLMADSDRNHVNEGALARIAVDIGPAIGSSATVEPYIGFSRGEEATPPLQPTMVSTYSSGVVVSGPRGGGVRLDWFLEDRQGQYKHVGMSIGFTLRN